MNFNFDNLQLLAQHFWEESQLPRHFPIHVSVLEQAILLTRPISIVKINKLTLNAIVCFLYNRGISLQNMPDNKELYGFVISQANHTYIFINGAESVQEQSFTLAHEFAHFLLDYEIPRQELINKFGLDICDALNNKRPFSSEERIAALVKGINLKQFSHLLDVPAATAFQRYNIWKAEAFADQLALELLAPYKEILQDSLFQYNCNKPSYTELVNFLPPYLVKKYFLSNDIADSYTKFLANKISGGITLKEKLGI